MTLPNTVTAVGHAVLSSVALRGGGADALDLARVKSRLEGLHTHGVVTALMMNAALRIFSSTPKTMKEGDRATNIAKILFTGVVALSVISGVYTTVVFALLDLYSKSALGLEKDQAFVEFFSVTALYRKLAFDAFLVCLVSLKASFTLSLFLNFDGKMRWWVSGVAAAISLLSLYHWHNIMTVAGRLLFS